MKKRTTIKAALALAAAGLILADAAFAQEAFTPETCYESRGTRTPDGEVTGYTVMESREIEPGWPSIKCSSTTSAVLWWGDPFEMTAPMMEDGGMPVEADYTHEEAVVRPRTEHLTNVIGLYPCADMCHGDPEVVPVPKDTKPRVLVQMHLEKFKDDTGDPAQFQHGRQAIWCLDCHSRTNRSMLIDHRGNEISFNQPQKLCGKCHGLEYRDWREGIHGKRIGMWNPGGKKRWWVCTECHDPHNMQQLPGSKGFAQVRPEPAPELPRGMKNANHEQEHHGGAAQAGAAHGGGSAAH